MADAPGSANPLGTGAALAAGAAEAAMGLLGGDMGSVGPAGEAGTAKAEQKILDPNNIPETEDQWRSKFLEMLDADSDKQVFTRAKKEAFINELRMLREKSLPAEAQRAAWNHARAYALLRNGDAWDLTIKGDANKPEPRPVAIVEDYFSIIKDAHERLNHQAIQATHREVRKAYAKVPRWAIEAYCAGCTACRVKKRRRRTHERVVTASVMYCNERWHLSHVDLEGSPDGEYKYIIHVLDHFSHFSMLRPAKSLEPGDVAEALYDMVGNFGLPLLLQGSPKADARPQVPALLDAFAMLAKARGMSKARILVGKPRADQTHAMVTATTMSVQMLVARWMTQQNSVRWSRGLSAVQLAQNTTPSESGGAQPMDVFTSLRRLGVYGLNLTPDALAQITTEEQLTMHLPGSVSSEVPHPSRKSLPTLKMAGEVAVGDHLSPAPSGTDGMASLEEKAEDATSLSVEESVDDTFGAHLAKRPRRGAEV